MPGEYGKADEKLIKGSLVIHNDQALLLPQRRAFDHPDMIFQPGPQQQHRRNQPDDDSVAGQDPFFGFCFGLGLHNITS